MGLKAMVAHPAARDAVSSPDPRDLTRPNGIFAAFAAPFLDELRPDGVVERWLVGRLIRAAFRAQGANPDGVGPLDRREASAERSAMKALDLLLRYRAAGGARGDAPDREDVGALEDPRGGGPVSPEDDGWPTRLVFDPSVSEHSPVVRGTWITAGRVISLIVDGWSWPEILRAHPELTEADLRACCDYATEADGDLAP